MPRLIALTRLARQAVLVRPNCSQSRPNLSLCSHSVRRFNSDPPEMYPPSNEPTIPEFIEKFNEPLEEKRSRLIYQSRKRGMLENGLLLGKMITVLVLTLVLWFILQEALQRSFYLQWMKRSWFFMTD